jgi:hypothetical protein
MIKKRGLNRKAQITVFMIVGIILLFSTALLFYIRGQIVEGIPEEFVPTVEEVPLEAQPIKIFVEDCLQQITKEGIQLMGAHGGYIDPRDSAYGKFFSAGLYPTESEALMMVEGSSALLPYWWYMSSPNDCLSGCEFDSNRPALYKRTGGEASIEGQLDTYIKRKLPECLGGFAAFREQGFGITELGDMEPDFRVAEREALVLLKYPIEVSREDRRIEIEQFFTKLDVKIKDAYDLASDITDYEISVNFLGEHTLNLISMYSKPVSTKRLPPTGHYTMSPGDFMIWTTTETRDRLESNVLPPGISMIQVIGTSNYQRNVMFDLETRTYDRIGTGIMDQTLIYPSQNRSFPLLEARMAYLDWWPIYLNINDEEVLKPEEIGPAFTAPLFDLLGMNRYEFLYDVSYPVVVMITDPLAFNDEGFKFNFALEANVRNNQAMNVSFMTLPAPAAASYLCDENQRNSGLITIDLSEMYTDFPIRRAKVDFIAGDEICFVGFTEFTEDGRTVLSANFPVGVGEIKIFKDNYLPIRRQFNALLDEPADYEFNMIPITTINATVVPIPLIYQRGGYILPPGIPSASLLPKESALMTFNRVDDDEYGDYTSFLMYNATSGPVEMLIAPGTYKVKGYIVLNQEVRIPEEKKTFDIPFKDDKTVTINETVFERWNSGGVEFNEETGYLVIEPSDMQESRQVRFKILRFPLPTTHSSDIGVGPDLEQLGLHAHFTTVYRHELEPDWIR